MFKKNDIIPLTIESITNGGSGIGHTDGIAVLCQWPPPEMN